MGKDTKRDKEIKTVLLALRKHYKGLSMLGSLSQKSPFYVLISTVLSQRNRDVVTEKVVKKFFARYKTIREVANADLGEMGLVIRQSGFYKTKAERIKEIARIILKEYKRKVPDNEEELIKLPGVGRKTANCVLVYAYGKPAIPVDTHVHRISNRLGWVKTKSPEETEMALMKIVPKSHWYLVNEVLVLHGQNICRPIGPLCIKCPVNDCCRKNIPDAIKRY
jgi:endonuclease III